MSKSSKSNLQTLERTIKILDSFSKEKPEWGVRELERKLNISKSIVHRILSTLQENDYLTQNPLNKKYKLNLKLYKLGKIALHSVDLLAESVDVMKDLSEKFDETVYLTLNKGTEFIYIGREDCSHPLRYVIDIGANSLMHAGAAGKAIMAFLDSDEINKILNEHGLPFYTTSTITEIDKLHLEFARIRQAGYAFSSGEKISGICGIAVPIFAPHNVIGSIAFSIPEQRFVKGDINVLTAALKEASRKISTRFGVDTK